MFLREYTAWTYYKGAGAALNDRRVADKIIDDNGGFEK